MALTTEQAQTRFLAIVLPGLTLCTHILLALSFALPGAAPDHAFSSFLYNVFAAGASILGVVGAVKLIPSLVSAYMVMHTITLSFVNIALVNMILPFDFRFLNPVLPSWQIDESAICRDIDAGFGWDEEWLVKCSKSFGVVKLSVACVGLILMVAQWWALMTVRKWGKEMRLQQWRRARTDVEKDGIVHTDNDLMISEKTRYSR
ncbi:uncharacterized protein K460DRAFT_402907 [Cucurbitaria berberidis CBS 394.84]|uniref:Uncharacterized protein n=1 Tax=Cucurbitaria berberidis CBS 394.84 TaxID=1168544 RepID=A0A9P4GL20_9PLEO|nr:uncharacterized protein K460DRAFT_402907 [Cucurbitaria berberidis CBS 394.84]KAF1847560.1 hypothetical protein K460DRAFT_402907 [Cucurbitaria berberidis CBS 394.84]